jgi:hypothetical protein
MAIFAELDESNNVIQVIVVNDIYTKDGEQGGIDFLIDHYGHNRWKQTWDNGAGPTKNYAGIGYTYDSTRDAFISQKPFESFVLNEDTCRWEAPVPKPNVHGNWGGVIHDNTVIWLATWKEEITGKNKYIFTSLDSFFISIVCVFSIVIFFVCFDMILLLVTIFLLELSASKLTTA